MSRKSRLISSLLTGFTVAFYFALVLPVQTYLANADSFNYTLGALLGDLCLPLVLTFAVATLALFFLSRWIGQFLHILLLALVVAAFAESGPLSIGLPELNGDFSGYKSLTRAIWDWSILLGIVLIPLCCYRWLRGSTTWIALALTVYLSATLFDVKVKSQRPEGMEDFIVPRLVPRTDVVRSAEFSPKRNVIMLILDSISVDACVDVFAADPDLASHFTGFVNYTNNVGMMAPTHMAIPGLFTGKYCESFADMSHYGQSHWMKDSFLKSYLDQNIPVYVNIALSKDGYTNRLKPMNPVDLPMEATSPLKDKMYGMYPMNLIQLSKFRLSPYFLKEPYVAGLSFQTNKAVKAHADNLDLQQIGNDKFFWQDFANKVVNTGHDMTLHVHHTLGGHAPTKYTREGGPAKSGDVSYEGHVEQCVFVFRQVAKLFDAWKANGVYDASTIFLLADHSTMYVRPGRDYKRMPREAFPFLMIKTRKSAGALRQVGVPTSHAHIAGIVLALAEQDLSEREILRRLQSGVRRYLLYWKERFTEYTQNEKGSVAFRAIGESDCRTMGTETVCLNREYSFITHKGAFFAGYGLNGGARGEWDGTGGTNMLFTFKVPEKNHEYDFHFWIAPRYLQSDQAIKVSAPGMIRAAKTEVSLSGVKSDGEGFVRVRFEKISEDKGEFAVQRMIVCEHVEEPKGQEKVLWSNDVEVATSKNNWNFKKIPIALSAGGTYRFSADQLDVTSGTGKMISVVLYNFKTDRGESSKTFRIDLSNSYGLWDWQFQVPNVSGDYRCLIYAGENGKTAGMGIRAKNVKITELRSK